MDYIKIPRSFIYKEREDLKDFGVQIPNTINNLLFIILKQQALMGAPGAREIALRCYNNAYYVCTLILLEANDFPELRISDYVDKILEIEKDNKHIDEVCLASMAMASLLLATYDEEKYGSNSEIWKAINYRCTHYQWYHSAATAIFLDMISLQYRFTYPLSNTEFTPRDIIEIIENSTEWDLQVYAEYICERLDFLKDLRQRVHGVDTAIARIKDYQRELCEDNEYNPKKDCFKYADNAPSIRDFTWEDNIRGYYQQSVEALDYYKEHYPKKEENDYKEDTTVTPQAPEVKELLATIRRLESELNYQEKQLVDANSINDRQATHIKELEKQIVQLQNDKSQILERNININYIPEKAFTASGKECFTKAKMGLLIYTIASLTDGPTPIKKQLVPIISTIGGWEETSVNSEMKKAGFNQKDIDDVAKVFSAMPNFASEIKKQIPRKLKSKK